MKTYIFDMVPINPNVNGIYYDMNSYEEAIKEYSKSEMHLYDRYDNDTKYYSSDSHFIIGKIESIDFKSRKIKVLLHECMQFIKPENYVIGFKLSTNNSYVKNAEIQYYKINSILYSCIIHKDFLK